MFSILPYLNPVLPSQHMLIAHISLLQWCCLGIMGISSLRVVLHIGVMLRLAPLCKITIPRDGYDYEPHNRLILFTIFGVSNQHYSVKSRPSLNTQVRNPKLRYADYVTNSQIYFGLQKSLITCMEWCTTL